MRIFNSLIHHTKPDRITLCIQESCNPYSIHYGNHVNTGFLIRLHCISMNFSRLLGNRVKCLNCGYQKWLSRYLVPLPRALPASEQPHEPRLQ